jgi:hypothetical protein
MSDVATITAAAIVENPPQQAILDECAEQIRFLGKRTVADLLEIGRLLDDVKHSGLGRAGFLQWVDHEFGWSEDTAERYIALHKLRRQLPQVADVSLPVSALYLLASPSTPLETAKDVVAKAQDGERVSVAEIKATVTEAKAKRKPKLPSYKPEQAKALSSSAPQETPRRDTLNGALVDLAHKHRTAIIDLMRRMTQPERIDFRRAMIQAMTDEMMTPPDRA